MPFLFELRIGHRRQRSTASALTDIESARGMRFDTRLAIRSPAWATCQWSSQFALAPPGRDRRSHRRRTGLAGSGEKPRMALIVLFQAAVRWKGPVVSLGL